MSAAGDRLAEFFAATQRYSPQLGGRDGLRGQVDSILNELQIPASLDKDGDWRFASDVGPFFLLVEPATQDLVAVQHIETLSSRPSKHADGMLVLLLLNYEARGAAFSAVNEGGKKLLMLSGRIPSAAVDRGSVEGLLADAMRISRRLDEVLGKETPKPAQPVQPAQPPQPPAAQPLPPPGWHPDPGGAPVQRWWDGQRWTEHTSG
jgi:hypothetical protein